MTTKVTVEANHGRPVKVIGVDPMTGLWLENHVNVVLASEKRGFFVHSGMDLIIHEIQPDKGEEEKAS